MIKLKQILAEAFKETIGLDESHKIGDRVLMKHPAVKGLTGHIAEIRHGSYKGAPKSYTIDYQHPKHKSDHTSSIMLKSSDFKQNPIGELGEAFKEVPTHLKSGKPNPNHPAYSKHKAAFDATAKVNRAPRAKATPEENPVKFHHIDDAIGNSYPDAEPYDHLARKFPHLHRAVGKEGSKLTDLANKVVRANTKYKSFSHYADDVFKQHKEDQSYNEEYINELSKTTLGNYAKTANDDRAHEKDDYKADNRGTGVMKALDKLAGKKSGPLKGAAAAARFTNANNLPNAAKDRETFNRKVDRKVAESTSHQAKTTLKGIKNPDVTQRMAAHDIKPGIKGYADRIALLRDASAKGKLKEDTLDEVSGNVGTVNHKPINLYHKRGGFIGTTKSSPTKEHAIAAAEQTYKLQPGSVVAKFDRPLKEDIETRKQWNSDFGKNESTELDEWTSNKQDGREVSAKKNIMRDEGGVLKPGKESVSKHNYSKPKFTSVEESTVNESPSEYTANNDLGSSSAPNRKVRLKNKKTGATVGIFADFKAATAAHNNHPDKRNLHVESAQQSVINNVLDNLEELPETSVVESMSFSSYSKHFDVIAKQIDEELEEKQLLLDKKKKVINDIELGERDGREDDEHGGLAEPVKGDEFDRKTGKRIHMPPNSPYKGQWKKKPGVDESLEESVFQVIHHGHSTGEGVYKMFPKGVVYTKAKPGAIGQIHYSSSRSKMMGDSSLKESAFDWKKPSEPRYDWSKLDKDANKKFDDASEDGVTVHKAGQKPKKDPNAVKKAVGRPAGEYMGGYKLKGGSDRGAKIGAKVHTPERAANYKEMIDSRNHFKEVMNAAIKKRQAELA